MKDGGSDGKGRMAKIGRAALKLLLISAAFIFVCVVIAGFVVRQASFRATPYQPVFRSDPSILRSHVDFLSNNCPGRSYLNPINLNKAANYIQSTFLMYTAKVETQTWESTENNLRNVIASYGPVEGRPLVIGAHYDVYGETKGADDNASGISGLLELSRLFSLNAPEIPVQLVAYPNLEPPFFAGPNMGSEIHAQSLTAKGKQPKAMICLDLIGYYSDRQRMPYIYTSVIYPFRGDFIAVVGRWRDRHLAKDVKAGIRGAGGIPVASYSGPVTIGVDLSDHRSYWHYDCPAVLVTDTAFMRNENYHTTRDTPETLDYVKMARVVDGVFNTAISFKDLSPAAQP